MRAVCRAIARKNCALPPTTAPDQRMACATKWRGHQRLRSHEARNQIFEATSIRIAMGWTYHHFVGSGTQNAAIGKSLRANDRGGSKTYPCACGPDGQHGLCSTRNPRISVCCFRFLYAARMRPRSCRCEPSPRVRSWIPSGGPPRAAGLRISKFQQPCGAYLQNL